MKTTKKFLLLLLVVATSNSASAQQRKELPASKPYVFRGTTAIGVGINYQWYRDGQPIPGATDSTYILPDHLAYGAAVAFKRGAINSACPGNVTYTNDVNVAFGLKVGNVYWASRNVAAYQTFAARPDMYTQFYQWNRSQAWSATAEVVSNWSSVQIIDPAWTFNPCPAGWRLPTQQEFTALNSLGSVWAGANTRGNDVAGRFYGPNCVTCTLPNNMYNCLFVPVGGYRHAINGVLYDQNIYSSYWSSTESNINNGVTIALNSTGSYTPYNGDKTSGLRVRCVLE